ncbi:PAS domain-containing protein [Mycobacterium szulgai]|uniref:PAS domain-containing protein n=1 Tax=Mycobacterium szulgai TaxID=1787 RepID=UPI0021F27103|nr:PAS domain-containing protein [Mycobacterium szulgai]
MRDSSVRRGNRWPRVGSFRYVASDDHWEWSDEVAQMHGYEPGRVVPTTDLLLTHKHPDEKPVVTQLVEWVRRHGAACGNRCRIVDTGGAVHLVIVVGNPGTTSVASSAARPGFMSTSPNKPRPIYRCG